MISPLVAVTAWRRELDTYIGKEPLNTLATYYSDSIINAGMTPLIFPNGQSPEKASDLIDLVDGLVISGGDDVHPSTYGEEPTTSSGHNTAVDQFEVALISAARLQNKPVLAICRGLQILNVALGGTINQNVTGTPIHEPFEEVADPDELNARQHVVSLTESSILSDAYQTKELKTNTLHHQGIKDLAPDLVVEGTTDDGLIEAARCNGTWWALGVQWHPERSTPDEQAPLFAAFRQAIEGRPKN